MKELDELLRDGRVLRLIEALADLAIEQENRREPEEPPGRSKMPDRTPTPNDPGSATSGLAGT